MASLTDAGTIKLVKADIIPLFTCVSSLTWVLHDYFLTFEDEVRYIWPTQWNTAKVVYFWVRIYTILATAFDVAQIHSFSMFDPSIATCVAVDPITRVLGAISLWSVEIVMQMRIYALYGCSKPIAIINGTLFVTSIAGFLWILVINTERRAGAIREAKMLPIPGCPSIQTGTEYLQWIPAAIYEGILFGYALFKTWRSMSTGRQEPGATRISLFRVIVQDNLLYFFGSSCVLVFYILMVVSMTHIPWFSFGPFHSAMGIMTIRMLLHLRKAVHNLQTMSKPSSTIYRSHHTAPTTWRVAVPSDEESLTTERFFGDDPDVSPEAMFEEADPLHIQVVPPGTIDPETQRL